MSTGLNGLRNFCWKIGAWRVIIPAMRFFTSINALALLASLGFSAEAALAQQPAPSEIPRIQDQSGSADLSEPDRKARLDGLFGQLKRERDPEVAKTIVGDIRNVMTESGSATVDLLMGRAAEAIASDRKAAAFDYLDQVIVLRPDFAEGWNLRATLHFALGNTRKSISDLSHVLALEPRHLGALSGLAGIFTLDGRDEAALKVWETYLTLYPVDRNAQDQARDLLEKMAGSRT